MLDRLLAALLILFALAMACFVVTAVVGGFRLPAGPEGSTETWLNEK